MYYLHYEGTTCSLSCPTGQYIDSRFPNLCQPCNSRCISCSIVSTNCTDMACAPGYFYYNSNCFSVCPYGTYSNSTNSSDQQCYKCSYFTLNGLCLQKCPSGYTGVVGNVSFCELCSDSTCLSASATSSFSIKTTVANNG